MPPTPTPTPPETQTPEVPSPVIRREETVDVVANLPQPGLLGIPQIQVLNSLQVLWVGKYMLKESKFSKVEGMDKAYHCFAHCVATQQNGDIGEASSIGFGEAWEILQFTGSAYRLGWRGATNERRNDLAANARGRALGVRGGDCATGCGIR